MGHNKLFILVLLLVGMAPSHGEEKVQSLDSIYTFVKETVIQKMAPSSEYEIKVLPLDGQLQLSECPVPLEAFKADDSIKAGRTTIGVRCNAEKRWSIFVSVTVKVYESVIVLTRPIQRGEIVTGQHLTIEKRDISGLHGDFATAFDQVENKESVRNMPAGVVLGLKSVVQPPLIKRKDKVIISSGQDAFSIQMNGTALVDGAKGQVIKVKNESSGRIISGVVLDQGLVFVK